MYCDHCYRDSGCKAEDELNTTEAKILLEQIVKAGFKIMIFSGGEPLLRSDIVELVNHAASLGLRPVLGTNGTLLTVDKVRQLKAAGAMGVGISLDSLDSLKHNEFRHYPQAWEEAVQGLRNCHKIGLPFQIHTTVMDWNSQEIENITDFAVQEGAVAHHFFFLVPTGRAVSIEEENLRSDFLLLFGSYRQSSFNRRRKSEIRFSSSFWFLPAEQFQ
jgi:MoaA/NifB/PqqE/SkfB family radical SAM enzyme